MKYNSIFIYAETMNVIVSRTCFTFFISFDFILKKGKKKKKFFALKSSHNVCDAFPNYNTKKNEKNLLIWFRFERIKMSFFFVSISSTEFVCIKVVGHSMENNDNKTFITFQLSSMVLMRKKKNNNFPFFFNEFMLLRRKFFLIHVN